jgi:pyruvate/2-oxoglutarate dehydrogenase complex dihydrolipoamide acyltransferase (E2) component
MQNIFIVNGRPGWYTSYMIARANKDGVFKGRITWETTGEGDALKVTAKAVLAETGEAISASADMKMAQAEGWTKNAKYKSMPEHMLRWRSAAMLVRLFAPEVMLGMPVVEELETVPAIRDVTPRRKLTEQLDALAAKPNGDNDNGYPQHDPKTGEILYPTDATSYDPETGEILDHTEQAPAAASKTATVAAGKAASDPEPRSPARKPEAAKPDALDIPASIDRRKKAAAPDAPKSADEYVSYAQAWIASLIDPQSTRWVDEMSLRNDLRVPAETVKGLKNAFEDKIAQLMAQGAENGNN